MSVTHKMGRAMVGTGIDGVLRYVKKDREKGLLNLVDLVEKIAGDMFQKKSYEGARTLIRDENGKWMQYVNRLLDETDPRVLKTHALNLGYEAAYYGTKTIREKRKELQCNVPWLILLDPTSACNLHCTGCWAAEYGHKLNLTYEEIDSIVTQGKELGIYFYMYTGGEPLMRKKDLIRICEKHSDCIFHAFTNGTLIDEKRVSFLAAKPPARVNITLYGASAQTYQSLCGDGSCYERAVAAIKRLTAAGVKVRINATFTQYNIHDREAIYEFADSLKLPVSEAVYMFPPVRRDEAALERFSRLDPEYAGDLIFDRLRRTTDEAKLLRRCNAAAAQLASAVGTTVLPPVGQPMKCRAGRAAFWITYNGQMRACGMMPLPTADAVTSGFEKSWHMIVTETEKITLAKECSACIYKEYCTICAAMAYCETGKFDKIPKYTCKMTQSVVNNYLRSSERSRCL